MKKHFSIWKSIIIILLIAYILNLGAGVIEFIPDNLPIIGNLDEGTAGAIIGLLIKSMIK